MYYRQVSKIDNDTMSDYICKSEQLPSKLFTLNQLSCCDPFKVHKKRLIKDLRVITLEEQIKYSEICDLIPGQKLCTNCRKKTLPDKLKEKNESSAFELEDVVSSQHSNATSMDFNDELR